MAELTVRACVASAIRAQIYPDAFIRLLGGGMLTPEQAADIEVSRREKERANAVRTPA